jgi:hypothetical protein
MRPPPTATSSTPSPARRLTSALLWIAAAAILTLAAYQLLKLKLPMWPVLPVGALIAFGLGMFIRRPALAWFGALLAGVTFAVTLIILGEIDRRGPSDDWVATLGRVVIGGIAFVLAVLILTAGGAIGATGARFAARRATEIQK